MAKIQVFLDTDVIISSLLSKTGASYQVINSVKVKRVISKSVEKETKLTGKKLNIESQDISKLLKNVKIVPTDLAKDNLIKNYEDYVLDKEDTHVVAGAHKSKSTFLLSHNTRHFKIDKINSDFKVLVMKPGNFLQYLRSIGKF